MVESLCRLYIVMRTMSTTLGDLTGSEEDKCVWHRYTGQADAYMQLARAIAPLDADYTLDGIRASGFAVNESASSLRALRNEILQGLSELSYLPKQRQDSRPTTESPVAPAHKAL